MRRTAALTLFLTLGTGTIAAAQTAGSSLDVDVPSSTSRVPDLQPDVSPLGTVDPLSLAMRLIPVLKSLLQQKEGFDPRRDLLLQTPFRSYSVPADRLAKFKGGDPGKVLVDDGVLLYPVMDIRGNLVSSIHLKKVDGLWTELGYDAKNLSQALRETRQARALRLGPAPGEPLSLADTGNVLDEYSHVRVLKGERRFDFLGETGTLKGKAALLLTPLFDYPGLPRGAARRADETLRLLRK